MTNQTEEEAAQSCAAFIEAELQARLEYREALEELEAAKETLQAERSGWDESTFATGGGLLGVIGGALACLAPDPTFITKGICAAGILGGGLTVGSSEGDRFKEIKDAEAKVQAAQNKVDRLAGKVADAEQATTSCMNHFQLKVSPL
jgi:hypothetical protein